MALLVGIQRAGGEWDNFVLAHKPREFAGSEDVLGRAVPCFRYIEVYDGIPKDDMMRLANELKGLPKDRRRAAFLEQAATLRLAAKGGTLA